VPYARSTLVHAGAPPYTLDPSKRVEVNGMNRTRVVRWMGSLAAGWFLLLPAGGDVKPVASQMESLVTWTHLGSFESAMACELARQARPDRERSRAICVFSDDPRLRR
jgi:hypothetical protein